MKRLFLPVRNSQTQQRGFTVIELMIATSVFAVVLLIVTSGIIQITRVYFKGVTESTLQNTSRTIIDTISQAVQFNGGTVVATGNSGASRGYCIGGRRFSYLLGKQLVDGTPNATLNQTNHAFVVDDYSGCPGSAQDLSGSLMAGSRELLSPNMRLSDFSITGLGTDRYRITVRVVYGDDDLLNNPTTTTAACRGIRAGSQFCSVSELSTVVVKRVQ
ncbi:MAG TPA: prepilin-type N-terminal cleavage/methylation domain-containing protein [Nevskiaceae bacterium]|nr:prepilin-type N-terminal cleavage/methylation domain-containing protein [Nevskiaceae bacterium]